MRFIGRLLLFLTAAVLGAYAFGLFGQAEFSFMVTQPRENTSKGQLAVTSTAAPSTPVTNPLETLKSDDYRDIVDRPLFSANRKPKPPPPVATVITPPVVEEGETEVSVDTINPDDFSLVAVSSDGTGKIAVIKKISSNQMFYAREGDDLEGLEVVSIGALGVELRFDDTEFMISLFESKASPVPSESNGETAIEPSENQQPAEQTEPNEENSPPP